MPELDDLTLLVDAARQGGEIARSYFGGDYKQWSKGKGQPVTEADLAVDKFLFDTLTGARADYGWLSEESTDNPDRLSAQRTFIVDPIDGTIAFLKGRPHFAISIAVVENGRPVTGVVFNPITEECFAATAGKGATLNGAPIRTSACAELENCRLLTSRSLIENAYWSKPPNRPWPPMHIEQRNSIAYRLALVAAGQFDGALALSGKHDWDLAAGDLLVQEAGGRVTDHCGEILRYNRLPPIQRSMVSAGPALHALLLDRVRHVKLDAH